MIVNILLSIYFVSTLIYFNDKIKILQKDINTLDYYIHYTINKLNKNITTTTTTNSNTNPIAPQYTQTQQTSSASIVYYNERIYIHTLFEKIQDALADPVCTHICMNGGFKQISSCDCICTPNWTGIDCSIPYCYNNGISTINGCTCYNGYDTSSNCKNILCNNGVYQEITNTCTCTAGWYGTNCNIYNPPTIVCNDAYRYGRACEYDCSVEGIINNNCFFNVTNYMHDTCGTINGKYVCMCGGNYVPTYLDLWTYKVIYALDDITHLLPMLCALDVKGEQRPLCTTVDCCLSQSKNTCTAMGCILLNNSTCASVMSYNYNISTFPCIQGQCNDEINSIYAYIYRNMYYLDTISITNWIDTRYNINNNTWYLTSTIPSITNNKIPFTNIQNQSLITAYILSNISNVYNSNIEYSIYYEFSNTFDNNVYFQLLYAPAKSNALTKYYNMLVNSNYCLLSSVYNKETFNNTVISKPLYIDNVNSNTNRADMLNMCALFSITDIIQNIYKDTISNKYLQVYNNQLYWSFQFSNNNSLILSN